MTEEGGLSCELPIFFGGQLISGHDARIEEYGKVVRWGVLIFG